jgi:hypothetical protein
MLLNFGSGLAVLMATIVILIGAAELGYYLGRRVRGTSDPEARSQIAMVEGSLLGLLGLLIGFTFSMAVGRFDQRQELVIREANALGTAYLRSQFLPEPTAAVAKGKLREYVDARLEFSREATLREQIQTSIVKTTRLQSELWAIATEEARSRPTPMSALYAMSLNELVDLGERRLSAFENKVPTTVWFVLYTVASLAAGSLGFGAGLMGRRLTLSLIFMPVLVSGILTLLIDLDNPRHGLIRVSQESLVRFRDSVK